ncbi:MAG: ATP-binding protein [bacterium]|nr:ATP-binding protein [bacterium]
MYKRLLKEQLVKRFFKGKILIITGARQIGKTTLVNELQKSFEKEESVFFNCDNITERENLKNKDLEFLKQLVGKAKVVIIDEAQKVENIGNTLKLLVDYYKTKKQIIVTGSSSINLLDNTQEPLTGRKYVYNLFPLSLEEIYSDSYLKMLKELNQLLIFGTYPEVVRQTSFEEKKVLLRELASSSVYKDILAFQQVKSSDIIYSLLKALALQIGSQYSYLELSNKLGLDKNTVERYVDLLEKSFIIFRLRPFFKNKRTEISKLKKIYFYDVGIRNALINDFNSLENRNDVGALWENFILVERMKYRAYHQIDADQYFWRNYNKQEIDLLEEKNRKLSGYEIKWNKTTKTKKPSLWEGSYQVIHKENLKGFCF